MKTYLVFVDGISAGTVKAANHNAAEKKAKALYPQNSVSVEYTEV